MAIDTDLVGRAFPPTEPYRVTDVKLREFAAATGAPYDGTAPATFPIVLAFEAMNAFLEAEQIDLFRIVHGEQRFSYERPLMAGDQLVATLTVDSVRSIGGADIIGTSSVLTDDSGAVVCTTKATLVHRGADA
ncbi:FAS1-like dehydratase domain-containing protein [Nocardioides donggukensis]|uniref:MaoC family dehydratase N-terminal domain-containing protein n=1 Tax=Nocardioides donggukensis TaxID=2774019 RepID=A0A927K7T6_9ACTN|nr:MaoC family dehydratase N-terminal domain-containing protein [Nocardioides donggukensis]MBD8870755.1 MaoC family dehydratase N-terminal domain-containing protein [Nocardioides donggukensis]